MAKCKMERLITGLTGLTGSCILYPHGKQYGYTCETCETCEMEIFK